MDKNLLMLHNLKKWMFKVRKSIYCISRIPAALTICVTRRKHYTHIRDPISYQHKSIAKSFPVFTLHVQTTVENVYVWSVGPRHPVSES